MASWSSHIPSASRSTISLSVFATHGDGAQQLVARPSSADTPSSYPTFREAAHHKSVTVVCRSFSFSKPAKASERDNDVGFALDGRYASEGGRVSHGREASFSLNNDQLYNRNIGVGYGSNQRLNNDQRFGSSQRQKTESQNRTLFVGNLPWSAEKESLEVIFRQAGTVEHVEVVMDRITGRSRGFAFVTMSSVEEAETAVAKLDGYTIEGRFIRVSKSSKRSGGGSPRTNVGFASSDSTEFAPPEVDELSQVFVGNLSWGVDDVALENMFISYGEVLEARIVYDRETGRSKGFGFVTLSSPSEASAAISRLNGTNHDGRPLRVNLAKDRPGPRY